MDTKNKNIPVSITPVQSLSSPSSDPTVSWKTFRNKTGNYELSYPSNWEIFNESSSVIEFLSSTNGNTFFVDEVNSAKVISPIETWVKTKGLITKSDDHVLKITELVTILDNSAPGSHGKWYLFSRKDKIYSISTNYDTDGSDIDQILSTFKFTN